MVSQQAPAVVVATHGHCFDGMCSAALFTRLARARISDVATFRYHAQPVPGLRYAKGRCGALPKRRKVA
jgi:hypothetical protein